MIDKLSEADIAVLRKLVLYICEECGKHEDKVGKLQPHRLKRGSKGGKYIPRNIKMVCSNCHDIYSSADRISQGQST